MSNRYYRRGMVARMLSHLYFETRGVSAIFERTSLEHIEKTVAASELTHSAEVRVAIEASMPLRLLWRKTSPHTRALETFSSLKVWDTEANNGVLIYIDLADHAVEFVADRGVAKHIEQAYWDELCREMVAGFAQGKFEAATLSAIEKLGRRLALLYPVKLGDKNPNELPDLPVLI
jgi:uncharacterized membrane protein